MTGRIIFYNHEKGFGFIKSDAGQEIFFHISGLADGVNPELCEEGASVSYEEAMLKKGPAAINVMLAGAHSGGSSQTYDDME